jgi:hypothetical protein
VFVDRDDNVIFANPYIKHWYNYYWYYGYWYYSNYWYSGTIYIWKNGSANPTTRISTLTISASSSIWYHLPIVRADSVWAQRTQCTGSDLKQWSLNGTFLKSYTIPYLGCKLSSLSPTPILEVLFAVDCWTLFMNPSHQLYCSEENRHQVVKITLGPSGNEVVRVAGTGYSGAGTNTLFNQYGIFVSDSQDLYVADCGNDRVQLFRSGQLNGTTVAGNGAPNTIALDCPTDVILDANEYLFISDLHYHRVVGSGPYGFRCIVGCWGGPSSGSAYLYYPMGISFDRLGNLYVADQYNHRIQKFNTLNNSCSECTS